MIISKTLELNEILIKPRFCEIDSLLIVHHSRFIPWVEEANFNFVEQVLNISRKQLFEIDLYNPIHKLEFMYKNNVKWDDELIVSTVMEYNQFALFTMHNTISCRKNPSKIFATAKISLLIANKELKLKLLMPDFYLSKIKQAEKVYPQYFIKSDHVQQSK
ncbi:MAG: hypothetical protein MUW56_14370 [Chryseobacterium sp.]|uniref:acyl-CoA thioesterase n=1 Tax=Chryseobacterium sp. TaxID=1871047 RepID=UPI0025BC19D8|nr:thioesterase family protein [Chryseobacterium sp.]MCJ7934771.1 hypothetical protein [Chryseobacterium sp.]